MFIVITPTFIDLILHIINRLICIYSSEDISGELFIQQFYKDVVTLHVCLISPLFHGL